MSMTRRILLAGLAAGFSRMRAQRGPKPRSSPPICLNTDQLPLELGYEEMGGLLKPMGFDGADLMVQPGGHITPEHADLDFMRAVESLNGSGVDVYMISTSFTSPADPTVRLAMQWGGEMGIPFFRPGHWKYGTVEIEQRLAEAQRDIAGFSNIARAVGMSIGIHNATPDCVGSSIFDTNMIIRGMDPHLVGYDFDPGYVAAQGGPAGFATLLKLAMPRIKMVTARDCYFTKEAGTWKLAECPLGEGMVDWVQFFSALGRAKFTGPITLQSGYAGKDVLPAIHKDLAFLKKRLAAV